MAERVFLLSPASTAGKRCQLLLNGRGELASRLRAGSVPLGELMSFLSSLYFRGKLTYAMRFATRGVWVITTDRGLLAPDTPITLEDLRAFARVPIDASEARYAAPLRDALLELEARLPQSTSVVLLGSIATPKYVDVLRGVLGHELSFPREFVGRGDMSRGGLLLRAAREGVELEYRPIDGAIRHGPRAARLDALSSRRSSNADESDE